MEKILFVIPVFNEELSIVDTIVSCRSAVPGCYVAVVDNNSTDKTHSVAKEHADIVLFEEQRGKGNAVRTAFRALDADIFIMVDGDNTYELKNLPEMISYVSSGGFDMVSGNRISSSNEFGRMLHYSGNRFFSMLFKLFFPGIVKDPFSGLRVFSKRFVDSFSALSSGFELETEINVHAYEYGYKTKDVDIAYFKRKEGSVSKLSTFKDGFKILGTLLFFLQRKRPLKFYSFLFNPLIFLGVFFFLMVLFEYFSTGLVAKQPTLITALFSIFIGVLFLLFGVLNENINRHFKELKRRKR